jgi:hypothetical protein
MKGLSFYCVSRALLSAALPALLALGGLPWWGAVLVAVLLLALFVWAVRSGRYVVHPERGVTAPQDDEYTRALRDRAARHGFAAFTLVLGGVILYYGLIARGDVPVAMVGAALLLGWIAYYGSDWVARRG